MNCPFCNLNQEKNRIIKEKIHVFVTPSNPRLMLNHLLIIPKRHIEKPSQLSDSERKELFETIIEFQEKILSKIAKGCDIRQHYRPFIPNSKLKLSHLHFHLHPREFEDELYQKVQIHDREVFKDLTKEEINETIEKFR